MKNGEFGIARQVFDRMNDRDAVAWNALLVGYSQNGMAEEALSVYNRMQTAGVEVDCVAVASAISACTQLHFLHQGMLTECGLVMQLMKFTSVFRNHTICFGLRKNYGFDTNVV